MSCRSRLLASSCLLLAIAHVAPAGAGAQSQIFSDGFESGDTAAWSVVREQRPGTLDVTAAAAMNGSSFGLEVAAGARAWVESREPTRETTVYVSFFFSADNWEMLAKARVEILRFTAQGRRHHLRLVMQQAGPGLYRVGLLVRGNRGGYEMIGNGLVMAGVENLIEVEWQAASTRDGTDGSATLSINGVVEAREPSLANGRLDVRSIRLGVIAGQTAATSGDLVFDTFESFRTLAP